MSNDSRFISVTRGFHPWLGTMLVLSAWLPAQGTFVAPSGLNDKEGPDATFLFTPWYASAGRYQWIDGTLRGVARPGIRRIELRRDGALPGSAPTRSTNVAVIMAHSDRDLVTKVYANNYKDTPVAVFVRKPVILPDLTSPPPAAPAPWSVAFPFDLPFSYNGNDDLLMEIQADGTSPAGSYSLDCSNGREGSAGTSLYNGLGSCLTPNGAFAIYKVGPLSAQGQVMIGQYALRGPSSSAGILLIGLSDPNSDSGLLCAKLRASQDVSLSMSTDALGAVASAQLPLLISSAYPGFPITLYSQIAILDVSQPRLQVALSDGIKWNIGMPVSGVARVLIYDDRSSQANDGTVSGVVPTMRFTQ